MDSSNALRQLAQKKREYEDLSRFVGARTSGAPNYTLLMGAGCSVSSNIRSAGALVAQWRREMFIRICPGAPYEDEAAKNFLAKNHSDWYNPIQEYSCLFEKNYDLPRQRRMFVEQEVSDKSPNLGYAYLLKLVEEGYLNTLFTTNFDDLLNEAFFQFSHTRPVVCAHDSSISSITVTSKRPKIIKLHGDYLFDDIKSTVRETESLEENTRKKFIEFGRDFGLIVAGYSGCDRSIMDVLHYLLRSDDYFKHGLYWCIKKGDEPSDELVKLLWRDRVYFVEVDGFDELMASLHRDLIGESLPIDTSVITNRPRSIINGFCKNSFLANSPSEIIRHDLERLIKQDEHEQLLSVFREVRNKSDDDVQDKEDIDDGELAKIIQIKQLINSADLVSARKRVIEELDSKSSKPLKERLLQLRVLIEEQAGNLSEAVLAVDSLIANDVNDPYNYIRKSKLIPQQEERMKVLDLAESVNPYSSRVQNRKVECNIEAYQAATGFDRNALLESIEGGISRSTEYAPGADNPVWGMAIDFYSNCVLPKIDIKKKLDELVSSCSVLGPNKLIALRARLARLSKYKEDKKSAESDVLVKDISDWKLRCAKSRQPEYEWLELDAYERLERVEDLSKRISELDVNPDYAEKPEYLRRKADFLITSSGDLNGSIAAMRQAVQIGKRRPDILRLAMLFDYDAAPSEVAALNEKYGYNMKPLDRVLLKRLECEAKDDIEGALNHLRGSYARRIVGVGERMSEVHDLLILRRYGEAVSVAKAALETIGWNKLEYGDLIVNFELGQLRNGAQLNKTRLKEVTEASTNDQVRACAYYLIGDIDKARDIFKSELRRDREGIFMFRRWSIFSDERGRNFIEAVIKAVG